MTRDRARKKAVRARMAATGEPYSVAARELDDTPAASAAVVREVIARVNATLAAPSAWVENRRDSDFGSPEPVPRSRPSPLGRLARLAAGAAWKRIAPEVDVAEVRERLLHQVGVGFVEPASFSPARPGSRCGLTTGSGEFLHRSATRWGCSACCSR